MHSENASHVFCPHSAPEKFENAAITVRYYRDLSLSNSPFSNCFLTCDVAFLFNSRGRRKKTLLFPRSSKKFNNAWSRVKYFPSTGKRKASVSKLSSGLKSVLEKNPFSWRISVDGRLNRRNKAAFLNFSGVVWTGPQWFSISFTVRRLRSKYHYKLSYF